MRAHLAGARTVGGVTAALLLLAACGSGSTTAGAGTSTPTSAGPTTTTTTTTAPASSPAPETTSGTRTLPDGKQEITDTKAGFQLVLPAGFTQVTDKKELAEVDGTTFFARDPRTGGTVSVSALPSLGAKAEDLVEKPETATKTTIGGLPALRVDADKTAGGAKYTLGQVFATKGDQMLIFSISIATKDAGKAISDVITSVRFLD